MNDQKVNSIVLPKLKGLNAYYFLTRPDQSCGKTYFIDLNGERQHIMFPQKIYLKEVNDSYQISNQESELSIFLEKKGDKVLVNQMFDPSRIGLFDYEFDFSTSFSLSIQPFQSKDLLYTLPFQQIMDAQFLGQDVLASHLGFSVFHFKIGDKVIFIKKGDLLVFQDGQWCLCNKVEEANRKPLIQISGLSENLEIDCFDGAGTKWASHQYQAGFPAKVNKPLEMIQDIRLRSNKMVSFCIEKQKVFLKENQWAMKKNGKWVTVEKDQIFRELHAEGFFYIKQIKEKEMTAYFINGERTASQLLNLTISKGSFSKTSLKKILQSRGVQ